MNFYRIFKIICRGSSCSLPLFLVFISISFNSFVDSSRGNTYINHDEPYKSFVAKILPSGHGRTLGSKSSHQKPAKGRSSKHLHEAEPPAHSAKSSISHPLYTKTTKGRAVGRTAAADKPNWYFSDPMKLMGKSILGYEPSDPSEPGPSVKVRKASGDTSKAKKSKKEGSKEEGSKEKGSKEQDSSSESKSSPSSSASGIRVVEFEGEEVHPEAPGWFALKKNDEFGRKLKLGSLLRKHGHGRKNRTGEDESDLTNPDDVGYSSDGNNNDTSEQLSRLIRRYDKNCLYLEYMDAKAAMVSPDVSESARDKIRAQNNQLSDFFLDLVLKTDMSTFKSHPLTKQEPSRGFELLDKTKEIFFKYICKDKEYDEVEQETSYKGEKDKLLPKMFVETVYSLFLKLYSITSSLETKDYIESEELIWIKSNLDQCNQTGGQPKKIKWFTDECKEQVLAFDQDNNFACTPYMEFDFNVRKYDPILDFVWHMITSVHSHCFESFQTNTRMWHRYALAMADLFPPEMRLRWSSSTEDNKKFYTRLFGPHYEVYFDNMNRCMYAANLRSNVPYLMPRFEGERQTRYAPAKYMKF